LIELLQNQQGCNFYAPQCNVLFYTSHHHTALLVILLYTAVAPGYRMTKKSAFILGLIYD